ncbi:DMT family transporter [Streptomyces sp. NPDC085929]|uniref:DMT family transporter n=1 Tax=Streptomyces sp. NPDC085929 TaxID=3365739 RepID=UPI0037D3AD22
MAWIVLLLSGVVEAVWATALGKSAGFMKLVASLVFGVGLVLSMAGLSFALREVPVGTGYAVWVGVGAVLTAAYAMIFDGEPVSVAKLLLLASIVGCVMGLKLIH